MTNKKNSRMLLALLWTGAGAAWAQSSPQLTTLYTFTKNAEGSGPTGTMAVDNNGVLYGITSLGGKDLSGVVFSLTPPTSAGGSWTEAVLYNFPGNGAFRPGANGTLLVDANGVVYGSTIGSVSEYAAYFNGTLYALKPPSESGEPWEHTVLCSFAPDDGPVGIAMGQGRVIYGITGNGGANLSGVVFSCSPPASSGDDWTETVLYNLPASNGTNFSSNLVLSKSGTIYTTSESTVSNGGSIFSLVAPASAGDDWTETTLYDFPAASDGIDPDGLMLGSGGVLYGTTSLGGSSDSACTGGLQPGCGVVYKLSPPKSPGGAWTQTVLHTFSNTPDGAFPNPVVVGPNGVLYGSTYGGGASNNGTIFSLTPPTAPGGSWTYAVLYAFTGASDGGNPNPLTLGPDGILYGTTYDTVFAFQP